jgi:hypothetical protein
MAKRFSEQINTGREKMEPGIQRDIEQKRTNFSKTPIIPQGDFDGQHFEEMVGQERFLELVDDVKSFYQQVTGQEIDLVSSQSGFATLQMIMMRSLREVMGIEAAHKKELVDLAIDIVVQDAGISRDDYIWEVQLGATGSNMNFQKTSEEPSQEEIQMAFGDNNSIEDALSALDNFDNLKAKRRFANALIQGSAVRGTRLYAYAQVERERGGQRRKINATEIINGISPELIGLYGLIMTINDLMYWVFPDSTLESMTMSGQQAGGEEVKTETDPPTIEVQGIIFPVVVHELVKAVNEAPFSYVLPDSDEAAEMVMGQEDVATKEIWDLRFGPIFWSRFRAMWPKELQDEDKAYLKKYLFQKFSSMTYEEFFDLVRKILVQDTQAETILTRMLSEIKKELMELESDREDDDYDDDDDYPSSDEPIDPDDLPDLSDDFLSQFGLRKSN